MHHLSHLYLRLLSIFQSSPVDNVVYYNLDENLIAFLPGFPYIFVQYLLKWSIPRYLRAEALQVLQKVQPC